MGRELKRGGITPSNRDGTSFLERFETSLSAKIERKRRTVRAERQEIVAGLEEYLPQEYFLG